MIAVICNTEITNRIDNEKLIKNPRRKGSTYDVENTSYDLMAGIAICKRTQENIFEARIAEYRYDPKNKQQPTVTLKPGQMMFVITHEEVKMPMDLCGTVYSRNSLALKGILALNAGHIDPGYEGPISIRLINLSSVDFTLMLGEPIYTIVFTRVDNLSDSNFSKQTITQEDMVKKVIVATNIGLSNALYDLALLKDFVKKDEFGRSLGRWLYKSLGGIITLIVGLITTTLTITVAIIKIIEFFEK